MGKSKRNVNKDHRVRPTGLLSEQETDQIQETTENVETDYPILDQLSSPIPSEREFSCLALANLVLEDQKNLEILLKHGGLRKLIQALCDVELAVRIAAAGALRNITIAGGDAICEELVSKDSLTPIVAVIQQVHNLYDNVTDTNSNPEYLILLQEVISLLSYLSESSEKAASIFVSTNIANNVIKFLQPNKFPVEVNIVVAQFLNVITDENPSIATQILNNPESLQLLQRLLGDESLNLYFRCLVSSIGYNLRTPENELLVSKTILPLLTKVLEFDAMTALVTMEPKFASVAIRDEEKPGESVTAVKKEVEQWRQYVQAQHLALQILTNIASENTLEDWQEEESMSEGPAGREVNIPEELVQFFVQTGVLPKVLNLCRFPTEQVKSVIAKYSAIKLDIFAPLQMDALTCLGNLLLILTAPEIPEIGQVWNFLCELGGAGVDKPDYMEMLSSCMWSLMRKHPKPLPFTVNAGQMQGILFLSRISASEEVRINSTGMLGILGQQPQSAAIIGDFAACLLESLKDSSLVVIAESLNSIFDIFAETEYNDAVKSTNMMKILQETLQHLRQQLPSLRRTLSKEFRVRVEEAELNLQRFIEYKRPQFK